MPLRFLPVNRDRLRRLFGLAGLLWVLAPGAAAPLPPGPALPPSGPPRVEPAGETARSAAQAPRPAEELRPALALYLPRVECVPRAGRPASELQPPVRRDRLAERSAAQRMAARFTAPPETAETSTAPRCPSIARWCLRHSTTTSFV